MEFSTLSKVSIKCSNEIFLRLSLIYHPPQVKKGNRKHLDNDEKVKLWTCLATPGLPSEVKSGPALSVSLKSVSSVSLTVPPGCRQEEGFLEKGRLLPREVREWRKGKPSLFTSSSSSIMNHPLPPLFTSFFSLFPLSLTLPLRSAGPCRPAGCQQTGTRALSQGERGRKAKSELRQLPRSAGVVWWG